MSFLSKSLENLYKFVTSVRAGKQIGFDAGTSKYALPRQSMGTRKNSFLY